MSTCFDSLLAQQEKVFQPLGLRMFAPSKPLSDWVQCYWVLGSAHLERFRKEAKLYPDAGSSLSLRLDEHSNHANLALNNCTNWYEFDSSVPIVSIRFRPGGLRQLLGIPVKELNSQVRPLNETTLLDALDPTLAKEVDHLMLQMRGMPVAEQISSLERWLLRRLEQRLDNRRAQRKDQKLQGIMQQLKNCQDQRELESRLAMSAKTVQRGVKEAIGLNPSEYFSMQKMRRARELLASGTSITDTALTLGYFDQSHFHHNFKSFILETPAAYQRRKLSQFYKTD